jgi:hypothetical protein
LGATSVILERAADPVLARLARRVVGLIVAPVPGRIVRAGILARGCERISVACPSSTALLKVATSMPAV